MKKQHRQIHKWVWLLLVPLLLWLVFWGLDGRRNIEEAYPPSAVPVEGGVLP